MCSHDIQGHKRMAGSFLCARFGRCCGDPAWAKLLRDCCYPVGHILVIKSVCDRKHMVFCGHLLSRRHCFCHIPPHRDPMQALLGWEGGDRKPTRVLNWELTVPGSNPASADMALLGHRRNCHPTGKNSCTQSSVWQGWV